METIFLYLLAITAIALVVCVALFYRSCFKLKRDLEGIDIKGEFERLRKLRDIHSPEAE